MDPAGWLAQVRRVPSPHFNQRPSTDATVVHHPVPAIEHHAISLMVIHAISLPPGQFECGAIEQFFLGTLDPSAHPYFQQIAATQVSSHFLLGRDGAIIQFVSTRQRAWHAGQSSYLGVEDCNNYSIGIELVGDDATPYSPAQYLTLSRLCQVLLQHYPQCSTTRIVGHSDIAPGRKTDPGPFFDWIEFYRLLAKVPTADKR